MSLSKEDLLASLSLGSDSAPTFEDTIGIEMSLEDLEKQCALLGPADTAGPTRAARPVRNPQRFVHPISRQIPSLSSHPGSRPSINGRPEETNVRKTIIHQNTKTKQGKIIQIGNWVCATPSVLVRTSRLTSMGLAIGRASGKGRIWNSV